MIHSLTSVSLPYFRSNFLYIEKIPNLSSKQICWHLQILWLLFFHVVYPSRQSDFEQKLRKNFTIFIEFLFHFKGFWKTYFWSFREFVHLSDISKTCRTFLLKHHLILFYSMQRISYEKNNHYFIEREIKQTWYYNLYKNSIHDKRW